MNNKEIKHRRKGLDFCPKGTKGSCSSVTAMAIVGNVRVLRRIKDESGLNKIKQLIDGNVFEYFSQLRNNFALPLSNLYTYKLVTISQKTQTGMIFYEN